MEKKERVVRSEYWLVGIVCVGLLVLELVMLFFNRLFSVSIFGVINDFFAYLLIALAINFVPRVRVRKAIFTAVLTIISLLFVIDATYSAFFGGLSSVNSLRTLGNLFVKTDIGVRVPVAGYVLCSLYAIFVFFIWFIRVERRTCRRSLRYVLAVFLAIVLSMFSINSAVISSVKAREYDTKLEYYASNSFLYDNFYNSYRYTTAYGYINYRVRDFTFSSEGTMLYSDIADHYSEISETYTTDYTALLEGKNLINVLCETFDTRIVSPTLMPNFTAAMEQSLIFDNYYVPTFFEGATINTEYMSMTGMLPICPKAWANNMGDQYNSNYFKSYSLPGQMAAGGYSTYYVHLGYERFYSRNVLMPNLGFETTLFVEDLPYNASFYDTEIIDLLDGIDYSEDFYASILTYSMHVGNDDSFTTRDPDNPNYQNYQFVLENYPNASPEMQMYLTKARCFDDFVGLLFDKLEAEGVLDETVVLFYPDHYTYGYKGVIQELGQSADSKEVHHQFLTMYLPSDVRSELFEHVETQPYKDFETARKTDLLASTLDLTPTLVNLFLKNANHKYFAGSDMLSGNGIVFFSDYTIFDGEFFLDIDQNIYSYTNQNQEEMQAALPKLKQKLEQFVELTLIHKIMLDIDYFLILKIVD